MSGKWPPPPDYDVNKFTVTETTYGDMCHIPRLLAERRRAQNKAWPKCAHTHIPPPPPPMICMKDPQLGPLMTETFSPGPIHTSIDDASRYDLYQHTMDRYGRCQEMKPRKPRASTAHYGRWGSNWSNFTEGRNATGGFNVFINGNARFKAEDEDRRAAWCDCFGRRRMPLYATNRTSRLAMERSRQDPLDTYCNMLIDPERTCDLDYTAANFGYDIPPPPEYKYKGFYQHRPFRGTVGIPAYNKAMEGYYALNQHESRRPQPVTI